MCLVLELQSSEEVEGDPKSLQGSLTTSSPPVLKALRRAILKGQVFHEAATRLFWKSALSLLSPLFLLLPSGCVMERGKGDILMN